MSVYNRIVIFPSNNSILGSFLQLSSSIKATALYCRILKNRGEKASALLLPCHCHCSIVLHGDLCGRFSVRQCSGDATDGPVRDDETTLFLLKDT